MNGMIRKMKMIIMMMMIMMMTMMTTKIHHSNCDNLP